MLVLDARSRNPKIIAGNFNALIVDSESKSGTSPRDFYGARLGTYQHQQCRHFSRDRLGLDSRFDIREYHIGEENGFGSSMSIANTRQFSTRLQMGHVTRCVPAELEIRVDPRKPLTPHWKAMMPMNRLQER